MILSKTYFLFIELLYKMSIILKKKRVVFLLMISLYIMLNTHKKNSHCKVES